MIIKPERIIPLPDAKYEQGEDEKLGAYLDRIMTGEPRDVGLVSVIMVRQPTPGLGDDIEAFNTRVVQRGVSVENLLVAAEATLSAAIERMSIPLKAETFLSKVHALAADNPEFQDITKILNTGVPPEIIAKAKSSIAVVQQAIETLHTIMTDDVPERSKMN